MKMCLCPTYMEMFVVPVSAADSCNLFTEITFHFYWGRNLALLYGLWSWGPQLFLNLFMHNTGYKVYFFLG